MAGLWWGMILGQGEKKIAKKGGWEKEGESRLEWGEQDKTKIESDWKLKPHIWVLVLSVSPWVVTYACSFVKEKKGGKNACSTELMELWGSQQNEIRQYFLYYMLCLWVVVDQALALEFEWSLNSKQVVWPWASSFNHLTSLNHVKMGIIL